MPIDRRSIVVYVAGPYTADTWGNVIANVGHAMDISAMLLHEGYTVICPHSMTHTYEQYALDYNVFIESDLQLVTRSDVLFVLRNWGNSSGTQGEIARAMELGLCVVYEEPRGYDDLTLSILHQQIQRAMEAKQCPPSGS